MWTIIPPSFRRWLKFNIVGVSGMVVHFGLLAFFVHVIGMHYLLATGLSIEAAVLQNFLWHRRWTWSDRNVRGWRAGCWALLRFNLTNGLVSLAGYSLSAWVFAGALGLDPVLANGVGLVPCGIANFLLADWLVFPTTV